MPFIGQSKELDRILAVILIVGVREDFTESPFTGLWALRLGPPYRQRHIHHREHRSAMVNAKLPS